MIHHRLPCGTQVIPHNAFFRHGVWGRAWHRVYPYGAMHDVFYVGMRTNATLVTVVGTPERHGMLFTPGIDWRHQDGCALFVEFPDLDTAIVAMEMGWWP